MSEAIGRRQGMSRRDLQPLGVLVEHRVDDVDERLVAVEQAVAAGQQVALEPALAEVLARAPPSPGRRGARWSSLVERSASQARSVASNTAPRRFEAVSSGPMRRKFSGLARDHVAQERAEHARRLARRCVAGRRHLDARSRGSRAARGRAAAGRRWRAGWRPSAARRRGASAASSARSAPSLVEQLLGPVGAHPLLELREVLGVACGRRRAAPGGSGTCPRPAARRRPSGRSSPSACAARSSASAAASRRAVLARARAGSSAISSTTSSSVAAISWCIASGSCALDEARRVAVALEQRRAARRRGSARARSGWRSCSR